MVLTTVAVIAGGLVIARGGQTAQWWDRCRRALTRGQLGQQFRGDLGDGSDRSLK
jgi:hypothetical protein